jgi:signal peptidase II
VSDTPSIPSPPSGAGGATELAQPAWRFRAPWLILGLTVVAGVVVDLLSKYAAFRLVAGFPVAVLREQVLAIKAMDPRGIGQLIPAHEPVVVVPHVLNWTLVLNPGAVFGMGAGQRAFFIVFTTIAVGFAIWLFALGTRVKDRWAHVGIGLLIAGGFGNLYDRVFYACVRDFIHPLPGVRFPFGWDPWNSSGAVWPYVSNVADLFLLIGIAIVAVHLWRRDPAREAAPAAE